MRILSKRGATGSSLMARRAGPALPVAAAALLLAGASAGGGEHPQTGTTDARQDEEVLSLDSLGATSDSNDGAEPALARWQEAISESLRFSVDLISRVDVTRRRGQVGSTHAVGLDIHKVFSDSRGDIGTLLLQPYLTRYDNAFPVQHFAEDDDDWELVFHNFYFNLTRWGKGTTNIKIGHFDIPYGLEPNVDTHVTVYQLISHENLGADMDWGVSLNGTTTSGEYEVAVTQGSGHEYINAGKNFVIAGRIGTPYDRNFSIGLSAMHGRMIDPHRLARWRSGLAPLSRMDRSLKRTPGAVRGDDDIVQRTRVGLDATWIIRQFTFKGEASVGRDFNQDVFNMLMEADWTNRSGEFIAYLQGIYLGQRGAVGWDEDVTTRLGAEWRVTPRLSVGGQYSQDMATYGTRDPDALFTVQVRYRSE